MIITSIAAVKTARAGGIPMDRCVTAATAWHHMAPARKREIGELFCLLMQTGLDPEAQRTVRCRLDYIARELNL